LTAIENQHQKAEHITTVQRVADGERFSFTVAKKFCDDHGIPHNNFSDLWSKEKNPNGTKIRNGFVFVSRKKIAKGIDQLEEAYQTLKTDKYSRRVYTTFWNPNESHLMALTPCWHSHQFVVLPDEDGNDVLHLKLLGRSLDSVFGAMYAIQQYRLYQMCMAKLLGFNVGKMSCDLTQIHIYLNQIEYAEEILTRSFGFDVDAYDISRININKDLKTLDDLLTMQWSDFEINHPTVNKEPFVTPRPPMAA
jgi:thymidylate synthase